MEAPVDKGLELGVEDVLLRLPAVFVVDVRGRHEAQYQHATLEVKENN